MELNGKYKIEGTKIGSGSFSEVYLGKNLSNGELVAIKVVSLHQKKIGKKKNNPQKVENEIFLMRQMSHPNIVKYYDVIKTITDWYIVMEYCNYGTLDDVINFNEIEDVHAPNFNREANTHYFMNQLKDALYYLQKKGCIHRDIKPMNVLLSKYFDNSSLLSNSPKRWHRDENIIVKLADFGLSKYHQGIEMMDTICGSPFYMGPEILVTNTYNNRSDLWSYGVVMYQLLFGSFPIDADSIQNLRDNLVNKEIDFHLYKNYTPECYDLLKDLLVKDYQKRISWEDFFHHPWFRYWKGADEKNDDMKLDKINYSRIFLSSSYPLGRSNLTKMILVNRLQNKNAQVHYKDYPSSYPPNKHVSSSNFLFVDLKNQNPNPQNVISQTVNESSIANTMVSLPTSPDDTQTSEKINKEPSSPSFFSGRLSRSHHKLFDLDSIDFCCRDLSSQSGVNSDYSYQFTRSNPIPIKKCS